MKFFLDQDVYEITYRFLLENYFDVLRAKELGRETASDIEILQAALKKDRILITRDKDFGSLIFFIKLKCPGVILIRSEPKYINETHKILMELLSNYQVAARHLR